MKSALATMIDNRIAYDDALSVENGLGVRAEAELAAKDAALEAARKVANALLEIAECIHDNSGEGESFKMSLWQVSGEVTALAEVLAVALAKADGGE